MVNCSKCKRGIILDFKIKPKYDILDLRKIMALLRSENGCPWDREQDHKSIRNNFIEETYEVVEAIDKEDVNLLREELGDVLLQIIFHSQMEEENNNFTFDDVVTELCNKLIIRHPHVFGEKEVGGVDDVLNNWENIKNKVKGTESFTQTLKSVPTTFPALMRSQKISKRAAKAGMDYPDVNSAFNDLEDEVGELWEAIESGNRSKMEEELGDLLFACTNVAYKLGIDAEEMLGRSSDKFISRFEKVEKLAEEQGVAMDKSDLDFLNNLWKKAKKM